MIILSTNVRSLLARGPPGNDLSRWKRDREDVSRRFLPTFSDFCELCHVARKHQKRTSMPRSARSQLEKKEKEKEEKIHDDRLVRNSRFSIRRDSRDDARSLARSLACFPPKKLPSFQVSSLSFTFSRNRNRKSGKISCGERCADAHGARYVRLCRPTGRAAGEY